MRAGATKSMIYIAIGIIIFMHVMLILLAQQQAGDKNFSVFDTVLELWERRPIFAILPPLAFLALIQYLTTTFIVRKNKFPAFLEALKIELVANKMNRATITMFEESTPELPEERIWKEANIDSGLAAEEDIKAVLEIFETGNTGLAPIQYMTIRVTLEGPLWRRSTRLKLRADYEQGETVV